MVTAVLDAVPRRLGAAGSVLMALTGTLGTGVFIVFAPAARAAGAWILLAVVVAGVVAACTAFSSVDLARRCPGPGEGYRYGRELLTPGAGRAAGVALLAGRTASAAAAGGVFAIYVLPSEPLCVAIPVIVVVGALNAAGTGVTRRGMRILVGALLVVLAVVAVVGLTGHAEALEVPTVPPPGTPAAGAGPLGVLTAAALLFFALAGYPRNTGAHDRAGQITGRTLSAGLIVMVLTYLALSAALLHSLGTTRLAGAVAPLAVAVSTEAVGSLGVLVRVAAAAATVAALLAVLASVGRTTVVMADGGDLPGWLARTNRRSEPWRADLVATLGAVLIAVLAGPVGAVGLAACCLLVHYAVVNLAALRLSGADRRYPAWTALLGLTLCLALAVLLPLSQVLVAASLLVLGVFLSAGASAMETVRTPAEAGGSAAARVRPPRPKPLGTRRAGQH